MKILKALIVAISVFSLVGCIANTHKLNNIELGMTRSQVTKILGSPDSTAAQGNNKYLIYNLYPTDTAAYYGLSSQYFVRLINGKVESYGHLGDFDSTKK